MSPVWPGHIAPWVSNTSLIYFQTHKSCNFNATTFGDELTNLIFDLATSWPAVLGDEMTRATSWPVIGLSYSDSNKCRFWSELVNIWAIIQLNWCIFVHLGLTNFFFNYSKCSTNYVICWSELWWLIIIWLLTLKSNSVPMMSCHSWWMMPWWQLIRSNHQQISVLKSVQHSSPIVLGSAKLYKQMTTGTDTTHHLIIEAMSTTPDFLYILPVYVLCLWPMLFHVFSYRW